MDKAKLEIAILSDEQFHTLNDGGFFKLILDHPSVQVFSAQGTICVRLPGYGLVQIAPKKEDHEPVKS